ncbi:phosphatase PAP2 family protein [Kitasatospora sp. NPDC004240]
MDSEPLPLADPSAAPPVPGGPPAGREDDQAAPARAVHTEDRSTDRPTHTPRGERNGDPPGRPGALPPAPGRQLRVPARSIPAAVLPAALTLVLVLVSWQVAVEGPLLGLDRWVRRAVLDGRDGLPGQPFDHLGKALADLGSTVPAVPVLLGAGALAAWRARLAGARRWWPPAAVAALTTGLIPLLVVPAKAWFGRPGPSGAPLTPEQWGWYPSGHTATATLAYGVAALLLGRTMTARVGGRLRLGAALLSLGVGLGLIWSDYHWLLDVVASWCVAGLVLLALSRRMPRTDRPGPS